MEKDEKTVKIKDNICNNLKAGMFKKDAAVMAGISEKTLYRWMAEDDSFDSQVEASILFYKRSLIKNLNSQAKKNGMLALKILERRFPKEWGESKKRNIREEKNEIRKVICEIKHASGEYNKNVASPY